MKPFCYFMMKQLSTYIVETLSDGGIRNHLYLADESGHLVVVMGHVKSEFVNSIVLIKSWQYLSLDSSVPLRLPG